MPCPATSTHWICWSGYSRFPYCWRYCTWNSISSHYCFFLLDLFMFQWIFRWLSGCCNKCCTEKCSCWGNEPKRLHLVRTWSYCCCSHDRGKWLEHLQSRGLIGTAMWSQCNLNHHACYSYLLEIGLLFMCGQILSQIHCNVVVGLVKLCLPKYISVCYNEVQREVPV